MKMATVRPVRIPGRWREGFALDNHTVSSDFVGHDEFGHPRYDTKRTELGELLYRLKYGSDKTVVDEIAHAAAAFLNSWNPGVALVLPVPPSKPRLQQPVILLAEALGRRVTLPVRPQAVTRVKALPELGATMNAITESLYGDGQASEVFALTITRTRSRS